MSQIIAVVPNICEGRDQKFLDDLTARLRQVPDLMILDVAVDQTRNRTVYSFTGTKRAIFEGGLLLYEMAYSHIDMRQHEGEYPRVGAVDVFPFVPLKDATIEECKAWSVEFAETIAERFTVPVYLFGESARYRFRRDIEHIRAGEYEGFAEKMKDLRWKPDLGPDTFPEDRGVTVIGARHPLISFRVMLNTADEEVGRAVSNAIADPVQGLRHVRGHVGHDHETGLVMLSVSITNFQATPMFRVIERIRSEAGQWGAAVRKVAMIGLIPEVVLIEAAEFYMSIVGFEHDDLLERNIQSHLHEKFLFR